MSSRFGLMKPREAAEALCVSMSTIRRMMARGELSYVVIRSGQRTTRRILGESVLRKLTGKAHPNG